MHTGSHIHNSPLPPAIGTLWYLITITLTNCFSPCLVKDADRTESPDGTNRVFPILEEYSTPKSIYFGPRQALGFQARLLYNLESTIHKTRKGRTIGSTFHTTQNIFPV